MDVSDIMPPDWQAYNYTLADFDPRILAIYARLLRLFPGAYVNALNGRRVNSWCGLRSPACTIGAKYSAHRTGNALDMHHPSRLAELREWCASGKGLEAGILRVEAAVATPTWVHIDVMPPNLEKWGDRSRPYIFMP